VTSACALARTENDPPSWTRAKTRSANDGSPIIAPATRIGGQVSKTSWKENL